MRERVLAQASMRVQNWFPEEGTTWTIWKPFCFSSLSSPGNAATVAGWIS